MNYSPTMNHYNNVDMYDINGKYIKKNTHQSIQQGGGQPAPSTPSTPSTPSSTSLSTSSSTSSTPTLSHQSNPWKHLVYNTNHEGTSGISTKDYSDVNQYIIGQTVNGITRVNAPADKDIELSINNDPKMMVNPQGKVYINTDDHSPHFQEQLNVNGNIITNSAFIGESNDSSTDPHTTMLIGNAHQMSNKNTQSKQFSLAHHHDGTTIVNSQHTLHFAINGDTKMVMNDGRIGLHERNPQAPVHIKGNVIINGDVEVDGTLKTTTIQTDSFNGRLNGVEEQLRALQSTIDAMQTEKHAIKQQLETLTQQLQHVKELNTVMNELFTNNQTLSTNVDKVQSNIKLVNGKLNSIVNASNLRDVQSVFTQLYDLKSKYSKLNKDILAIKSF